MLLIKLSDAFFMDDTDNRNLSKRTAEFLLQYIWNCSGNRELQFIHENNHRELKEKDIEGLPKDIQKDIRKSFAERR